MSNEGKKGLFDLAKDVIKTGISDQLFALQILSRDFLEAIKKGSFFIPDSVILPNIEEGVSKEAGATLNACDFKDTGIHLEIQVKRYGAEIKFPLKVEISKFTINSKKQIIQFIYIQKDPIGQNMWGKIITFLVGGILSNVLNDKIEQNDLVIDSKHGKDGRTVLVDLGGIKEVQALQKKVPSINLSVLDVLTIDRAEHVDRGISLFGKLAI